MEGPRWPVECLGFTPDVDGDLVLDDCDPIAVDGPLADFDGDGVANGDDVCPAISNPQQETVPTTGMGVACDPNEDQTRVDAGRILVITTTVEQWNVERENQGLSPITWPVSANLTPEVEQWCAAAGATGVGDGDPTAEGLEQFRALVLDLPEIYRLSPDEKTAMADAWLELLIAVDELESRSTEMTDDELAEFEAVVDRFNPFGTIMRSTDQSCGAR